MKIRILLPLLFTFPIRVWSQERPDGRQLFNNQRYVAAEKYFHKILKTDPNDAGNWLWLTMSYIMEDKAVIATDSLLQAPVSVTTEPLFQVAKGWLLLTRDKLDSAAIYFDNAISKTKSKDARVLAAVADAHIASPNGSAGIAIDKLEKALKRDISNSVLYVKLGNAYRKAQKTGEAYQAFQTAIEKDKQNAEAYYRLGEIFLSQKNTDMYLNFFNEAVAADSAYAPAWYELYRHYLYSDPARALVYFRKYYQYADRNIRQDYQYADLLYLNKDYDTAISLATRLAAIPGAQPRIFKLIAYSYAEQKDSAAALHNMKRYFKAAPDSLVIAKDYETTAELFTTRTGNIDSAIAYYQLAISATRDSGNLYPYYQKLAALSKHNHDYPAQATWLGRYYMGNSKASNIDLFNWGIAAYRGGDYLQADSAFSIYREKYPDQAFGYYWLARSNAAIDTSMMMGLAVPHYQKLIDVVGDDSLTADDRKWLTEAYSYLAAYETNKEKDYKEAIEYFAKVLEIDPENGNAKRYIAILEESLKRGETEAQRF